MSLNFRQVHLDFHNSEKFDKKTFQLILPDVITADDKPEKKLRRFCDGGGKVLATGKSALKKDGSGFCLDLGEEWIEENSYCPDYFRPTVKAGCLGDTGYNTTGISRTAVRRASV